MNEIVNQIDMRQSGIMEGLSFDKLGELLSYQPEAPMLFSSGLFFILFCLFSVFYVALRKHTLARIIYVTLFSLYFYYKMVLFLY